MEAIRYEKHDDQMGTGTEVERVGGGGLGRFRPVPRPHYGGGHAADNSRNWPGRGGGPRPKSTKSVLLTVQAVDKSDGSAVHWAAHQYTLEEPSLSRQGVEMDPASREIRAAGHLADTNGHVLVQVPVQAHKDVTPEIADCAWYRLELTPASPWPVRRSGSHHPQASSVSPQGKFDAGARALARDDDQRIKNPTHPLDDVTAFVEFIVFLGRDPVFPGSLGQGTRYNYVEGRDDALRLLVDGFANVKVVTSIRVEDGFGGWSYPAGLSVPNIPAMLILGDALNHVPVHEWGHTVGLEDRYDSADALMWYHELSGTHREINASERGQINWSIWANARWGWH